MSEDKDAGLSATPQPGKYSRYRSVRHALAKESTPPVVPVVMPSKENDSGPGRMKSMSRYRRSRVGSPEQFESPPPMPTMLSRVEQDTLAALTGKPTTARRVFTEPTRSSTRPQDSSSPIQKSERKSMFPGGKETEDERLRRKLADFREREAQKLKVEEEKRQAEEDARIARRKAESGAQIKKQQKAQAELEAQDAKLKEEETARLLTEQKRKDLERLEATLDAAGPRTSSITSPKEKLGFFSRRRAASRATPASLRTSGSGSGSGTMSSQTRSIDLPFSKETKKRNASPPSRRVVRDPVALPKKLAPEQMIQEGGGGIVPQTDAPISASNAGERRVLIRCKQSSINLPVTPETTTMDLIFSAANIMTQNIVPGTAILLESYTQLGLERRVRRYEHIRDVMNSWDRDTQNSFLVVHSESPQFDKDLDASSAPKEAPASTTVYMYHSQKPGKWNKRYITLLPTGQIYMSKKTPEKSSDKDIFNLCHLSDFDIYSSTPQQTRKILKPPKEYCYAIKSQQKTTVFLSTENFVHYFSTDDETLSNKWYDAVQEWRSWYLVSRKGEGKKKKTGPKAKESRSRTTTVSSEKDPYTIGTFAPLLDMDRFDKEMQENNSLDPDYNSDDSNTRPRQIPFHLRNTTSHEPMLGRSGTKRHPRTAHRLPPEAEEEFASGGLLGRTYSQRQKTQKERDVQTTHSQGPFIEGPSLLNSTATSRPERTLSSRSTRASKRSQTTVGTEPSSGLPKPLLDFAPVFKEAPQWDKKGRGHGVKAVAGVPLVEVATTPEDVVSSMSMQPNATLFRRDQDVSRPKTNSRPKTGRGKDAREGPFVGSGLVQGAGFVRPGGSNFT